MADDAVYNEDFFQTVTNVQWGTGLWIILIATVSKSIDPDEHPSGLVDLSFPGISGGTPGYTMIDEDGPHGKFAYPHTVTARDLQNKMMTDAGKELIGFSISRNLNNASVVDAIYCFKLSGALGKGVVSVRMHSEAFNINTLRLLQCYLCKGTVKVGAKFSNGIGGFPASVASETAFFGGLADHDTDFRVDPTALTVTVS